MGRREAKVMKALSIAAAALLFGSFLLPSTVSNAGAVMQRPTKAPNVSTATERRVTQDQPRVRWVFRESDLVTCRTPSAVLRHLRARYEAAGLEISAYAVDMTQDRAESFFSAERLDFDVTAVDESWLRARSPGTPPPGLYFLRGDSLIAGYSAAPVGRYPDLAEVEPVLARMFSSREVSHSPLALGSGGTP